MNFLAHIYLSFNQDAISIGNFIADSVKGKKYLHYPKEVQIGIQLHRAIDSFTDGHPIVKQSSKRLHPTQGHYSGVVVDIIYDHFLAKNWDSYHQTPLAHFVANFYHLLETYQQTLPKRVQQLLPYMVSQNWLYNYKYIEGIDRVFKGMYRRTKEKSNMHLAKQDLEKNYEEFEADFTAFFQEIIIFSQEKLKHLQDEATI
ncbi:MAG: acyl carrier protein phosphodiesterase [Flavobacteriaceae bacterium]|nr:acyl carrier protein phosphodiesterase [Flavobacteriaceae bacterium]